MLRSSIFDLRSSIFDLRSSIFDLRTSKRRRKVRRRIGPSVGWRNGAVQGWLVGWNGGRRRRGALSEASNRTDLKALIFKREVINKIKKYKLIFLEEYN